MLWKAVRRGPISISRTVVGQVRDGRVGPRVIFPKQFHAKPELLYFD